MMYNRPPFAIATTTKTGISKPKDLEGKVLGAPAADGAFAQWKAFVKENGIDASKVKIENIGFPVREPMLADGATDAVVLLNHRQTFAKDPALDHLDCI